jgi:hypothetical protein
MKHAGPISTEPLVEKHGLICQMQSIFLSALLVRGEPVLKSKTLESRADSDNLTPIEPTQSGQQADVDVDIVVLHGTGRTSIDHDVVDDLALFYCCQQQLFKQRLCH